MAAVPPGGRLLSENHMPDDNAIHSDATTTAGPIETREAQVRRAERERVTGIMNTARRLGTPDDLAQRAISEGHTFEAFGRAAIDYAAENQAAATHNVNPSASASDPGQLRSFAQPRAERQKGGDAARCMIALAAVRGDPRGAADFVQRSYGQDGARVARALATGVGSSGGFLVPAEMASEVIELLRPQSAVMALGPRTIPMPNGNILLPRIDQGSQANYVGEMQVAPVSQPGFGAVQLSAKKLIALVPVSNDMIRFPSVEVEGMVRDDMVASIATRADGAFIRGNGTQQSPRGLLSYAASPVLQGQNLLQPNPVINLQNVTTDLGRLELALKNANVRMVRPGWIMAPRTENFLMNLRDGLGNLVYANEMAQGRLRGKAYRTTTQIPLNLPAVAADGTTATADGSEIYLADFVHVVIGETLGLILEVFPGGSYVDASGATISGISTDETVMRAIVHHDLGLRHEQAVAVLTGVRWY